MSQNFSQSIAQINIEGDGRTFRYAVQQTGIGYEVSDNTYWMPADNGDIQLVYLGYGQNSIAIKNINVWTSVSDPSSLDLRTSDIPANARINRYRLLFPEYSVDVYKRTKYVLSASAYVNGVNVVAGCWLVDRMDAKAVDEGNIIFKNTIYRECIEFDAPDIWSVLYDRQWTDFRQNVCEDEDGYTPSSSVIHFELVPVIEDSSASSTFIENDPYNGGSTSAMLGRTDDGLRLHLEANDQHIEAMVNWPENYTNWHDFSDYLLKEYGIDVTGCSSRFDFVIKDEENIYMHTEAVYSEIKTNFSAMPDELFEIQSWDNFVEKCFIAASYTIYDDDSDSIALISNEVPLTPDLFRWMITCHESAIPNIEEYIMNETKINIVNKIEQEVVEISRPSDGQGGMIKPIFIQSQPSNNIIVHPEVTENIPINLNAYKHKVNMFWMQIEGVQFPEIGRTASSVIFKLTGQMLPQNIEEGTYFILNEEKELVTTGSFIYKK